MKIQGLSETYRFLNRVQKKDDGGSQQHQQPGQDSREEQPSEREQPARENDVRAAVEAFQVDPQSQANGLQAETEGTGPGLRVVLKDHDGTVVRQFTGEEFVRMREAARDGRSRGKILDQKL